MPINVATTVFINAYPSFYPFLYFIILKEASKKIDNTNEAISNSVVKDNVYKLLKKLSLS